MTPEQQVARGARAKEILEDEIFADAFTQIQQEINDQWKKSPARDQEGREKLYLMLHLLDKMELTLRATMETGILAREHLKHQQSLLEKARNYLG